MNADEIINAYALLDRDEKLAFDRRYGALIKQRCLDKTTPSISSTVEARTTDSHVCHEGKTCSCYLLALEPNEDCPVHGHGEYPPHCCVCGRFLKSTRRQPQENWE
jgi:hypothetical protein